MSLEMFEDDGKPLKLMACEHCWHGMKGPSWQVIKDGHILQSCCKCQTVRQIHAEHTWEMRK